jgi:hypothetical protein
VDPAVTPGAQVVRAAQVDPAVVANSRFPS